MLGQYADPETGLHYNRWRYFDPETGRFLAPDLDPREVHHGPYAYGPNPIGWSNPLGLMPRFHRARDVAWAEVHGRSSPHPMMFDEEDQEFPWSEVGQALGLTCGHRYE
jgi:RHS repeat-associated protein